MDRKQKITLIKSWNLFSKLSDEEAGLIGDVTSEKIFKQNHVFIEEGLPGEEVYFIVSGLTRVYRMTEDGKEIAITMRTPGEVVGEMALIDEGPRSASVQTIQETKVLVLRKQHFIDILHKHPSVAVNLIKILVGRLRENMFVMEESIAKQLSERILRILQILASYFPNREITLSHEELAALLGASRPRVTEALHKLENGKKVTLSHKKIRIL